MLTVVVKQNPIYPDVYMGIETIKVQLRIPTVVVAFNEIKAQEPYTYTDAGLYNQEGVVADAQYYNTDSWDIVWAGGFV